MRGRRFVLSKGKIEKFWEYETDDKRYIVFQWGTVGKQGDGDTVHCSYATRAEAKDDLKKQLEKVLAKGYVEVEKPAKKKPAKKAPAKVAWPRYVKAIHAGDDDLIEELEEALDKETIGVDHRAFEDEAIGQARKFLPQTLKVKWSGDDPHFTLRLSYGKRSIEVDLPASTQARWLTMWAIGQVVQDTHELRAIRYSVEAWDTFLYVLKPKAWWAKLEAECGRKAMASAFVDPAKALADGPPDLTKKPAPRNGGPKKAAATKSGKGATRLEYVQGKSSKFWEISVSGKSVTVRFGRIGTTGQSTTRTHANEAAARKDADGMIQKKLKAGYVQA